MRRLLIILLLFAVPVALLGSEKPQSGDVAHGAEKTVQKQVHPDEAHGSDTSHAPKSYFGIPGWILKLLNMILFIAVLGYFVGRPVKGALIARQDSIRRAAEEAKERRAKSDQLAGDIQARLTQIEQELDAIRDRAQQEGERQKRELIAAAEAEAAKIVQAARNEVDSRLKHARLELTEYAGQLATDRAESLLREKMTDEDRRKLFRDSLQEVGGAS